MAAARHGANRSGAQTVQITARIPRGDGGWESVVYDCTLDGDGVLTKATHAGECAARIPVEIESTGTHHTRRGEIFEDLTIVRHVGEEGQEFCVRVTTREGELKYVCDLEGYIVRDVGEVFDCPRVPTPVLDSFHAGVASVSRPSSAGRGQ